MCFFLPASAFAEPMVRGMPFTRAYSLEEIGPVPRGSRLSFDRFGRLAVIHDAIYTVLNDGAWLNLAEPGGPGRRSMSNVISTPYGDTYYGGRGTWGRVEARTDGRLHPVPLVPADPPAWIATAAFNDLLLTRDGIYFVSWNGVVFESFQGRASLQIEVPKLSRVFRIGDRVYVSAFESRLHYIDLASGALKLAPPGDLDNYVVEFATPLDQTRSLVAFSGGRLAVFDGQRLTPWLPAGEEVLRGSISVLQQLVDGRIAIGVVGEGLMLYSSDGALLMALTTPTFRNITGLANREPGVLWVETEDAIEKVLYGSPLSAFGQRLGLPIAWPIVGTWKGGIVVASGGKLYRAIAGDRSGQTHFEPWENQPTGGAWSLAATGETLLVGSASGLFSAEKDGAFTALRPVGDLAFLVMIDGTRCFAIGREEIALLEYWDGQWGESVPRIAGPRNPFVVHRVEDSVWIEMGGDGVARLWLNEGRLQLDVTKNESWTKGSWVNVGSVDGIVVLSSMREEPRRFFDQHTGEICSAPWLEELLNRSPFWIARMTKDSHGVIWATHNDGLVRFEPNGAHAYNMDIASFDLVNDRYPVVRLLPGNDVWVAAERALYHVEKDWISGPSSRTAPVLVALTDLQNHRELLADPAFATGPRRLSYSQNNLSFRIFSGTDAWRRPPVYQYRLGETEPWNQLDGSVISFRGLHEGNYRLHVRNVSVSPEAEVAATLEFEIAPPWNRSWPAYLLFGAVALALFLGATRWWSYLERRRNRMLERLVDERTSQLASAMTKLGEETRKAATLAERDRLANEIHDTVQQGLTGAMLQIETTLRLPVVDPAIRARLQVMRKMVAYARQEVQNAVWEMESPLLQGTELASALRNLTAFVDSKDVAVEVTVAGEAVPLDRTINHNLLRVAQEATTNALRHAQSRHIAIRLTYEAERVELEIADDGVGFRSEDVLKERSGHLGLRGIRSRARKLRGTVTINSAPGRGTSIRVVAPLKTQSI